MALDRLTQITSSGISSTSTITVSAVAGVVTATRLTISSGANFSGVVTATNFNGSLTGNVTGNVTGNIIGNVNSTGVSTFSTILVGTAVTISGGIVTATSFRGDGSQLTGIAATTNVRTNSLVVSGVTTTNLVIPEADNTHNLGSSARRWANIFSADLQLSNEGSSNDIDGTWGKWTIQEGENDLFIINRRTGKKYKFMLEEVQ